MAVKAWYDYPITQGHGSNGEKGIDIGLPMGIPITALYAGKVTWAGRTRWQCGSSGGEVVIVCYVPDVPVNVGPPYAKNPTGPGVFTSYYLHLDTVAVQQGDLVQAGQVIGTSGGQLSGGNWPVVNCGPGVAGYNGKNGAMYSNGTHVEFGFNANWVAGPGSNIDPTWAILSARAGTLPATTPDASVTTLADTSAGASGAGGTTSPSPGLYDASMLRFSQISSDVHKTITEPSGWDGICEWFQDATATADWNWKNPIGSFTQDIMPWGIRLLFVVFGALMALGAVWSWLRGPIEGITGAVAGAAVPEVGAAGRVAGGLQAAPTELAK